MSKLSLSELIEFTHEQCFVGFTWIFDMECYVNRKTKIIVSTEYLESLTKAMLADARRKLQRHLPPVKWRFVFCDKPSISQRVQIIEKLED